MTIDDLIRYLNKRRLYKRAEDVRSLVRHHLKADWDVLDRKQIDDLKKANELVKDMPNGDAEYSEKVIEAMEDRCDRILERRTLKYQMRNVLDIVIVAVTVAFGIRALFLQPFKIPTSSMQPTLFGIHYIDREESKPYMSSFTEFFLPLSSSNAKIVMPQPGGVIHEDITPMRFTRLFQDMLANLFNPSELYYSATKVRTETNATVFTIPGTDPQNDIYRYLDENPEGKFFKGGETVIDGYLSCGDHLFVDRISMHFSPLERGEVFVFNTSGLKQRSGMPISGYYYVKRLVGLPGDTLKIIDDVLYVKPRGESKFRRADEFSDRFKKIYSGKGGYQGHKGVGLLANGAEVTLPPDCYFALGDNTNNSLDSRFWGFVPGKNIVGRPLMVFWPFSRRWGSVDEQEPIDVPTRIPTWTTQPTAMRLQ